MTDQPRQSTGDLIGELQRWLVRSGARGVSRQLNGQIRTVLGGNQSRADVWETATADHLESPECAWCPICRARRRLRESGPGLASGVAAAADAVNVVMQDAMSAFEAAVAAAGRQARPRPEPGSSGEVWEDAAAEPPGATSAPIPPVHVVPPAEVVPPADAVPPAEVVPPVDVVPPVGLIPPADTPPADTPAATETLAAPVADGSGSPASPESPES